MSFHILDIPELSELSIEGYMACFIIALVTFFFSEYFLKRFIKAGSQRKIATCTITLIATPIIYIGLISLVMSSITYTTGRDFDRSVWGTDREGRFQMAGDIIKSGMLNNKDSNQVKQLLGDPNLRSDTTYQARLRNSWFYYMGMGGGGLGFVFHTLLVKFDSNNHVEAVEHRQRQD
jgi:hypothetical protein